MTGSSSATPLAGTATAVEGTQGSQRKAASAAAQHPAADGAEDASWDSGTGSPEVQRPAAIALAC